MAAAIRGARRIRRLFNGLPGNMRGELVVSLALAGRTLQAAMRARAPRKTGALVEGILFKVYPKTLRLRVGLIDTPSKRGKLFYGRIQDLGRKGKEVEAHRLGTAGRAAYLARIASGKARFSQGKPRDLGTIYKLRVGALAPKRFITGKFTDLRQSIGVELRGIWGRALRSLTGGSDE